VERLLAGAQNADAAEEQRLLEDALDLFRGEPLAGAATTRGLTLTYVTSTLAWSICSGAPGKHG